MVVTGQNNPLYSWTDLAGSARPYPDSISPLSHPDSLTPVMITHVSRHGARFPTTGSCVAEVREFLMKAYDAGQLTGEGVCRSSHFPTVCSRQAMATGAGSTRLARQSSVA